jgi:hypothetical protein
MLEASSERLASGGDHLCTSDGDHLYQRLASGGDHLSMCAMARRSSPPSSYEGDDKTIQAKELEARR